MVNIDDFIRRLEIILDYYSLNASTFADKIGVQRSSLSHLLSGRNKPSLDFILKIIEVFPDVDLYWILNGHGTFPKSIQKTEKNGDLFSEVTATTPPTPTSKFSLPENLFSEIEPINDENPIEAIHPEIKKSLAGEPDSSEIDQIVFFYKNGTFKVYKPN